MHQAQIDYCNNLKIRFPDNFNNCRVLDIGALGLNGSNRMFFTNCTYTGIDVIPGRDVDFVSIAHEFTNPKPFNTIICTNTLEHDMFYYLTLSHLPTLLALNGLLIIQSSIAPRHGVLDNCPQDSGTTRINVNDHPNIDSKILRMWPRHYKNMSLKIIRQHLDIDIFKKYELEICPNGGVTDLFFYGVK